MPVVLALSGNKQQGRNLQSSSQVVCPLNDRVLYVSSHGNTSSMVLTEGGGAKGVEAVAAEIIRVLRGRFSLDSGKRRLRWFDDLGGSFGSSKGVPIAGSQAPFGPAGRFDCVVLVACQTGAKRMGKSTYFAQDLSNLLGVSVIAPVRKVNVSIGGAHPVVRKGTATPQYHQAGVGWNIFDPVLAAPATAVAAVVMAIVSAAASASLRTAGQQAVLAEALAVISSASATVTPAAAPTAGQSAALAAALVLISSATPATVPSTAPAVPSSIPVPAAASAPAGPAFVPTPYTGRALPGWGPTVKT